jgi:hypothetical protein
MSNEGASNGTKESINGGLVLILQFIDPSRQSSFLGIFGVLKVDLYGSSSGV